MSVDVEKLCSAAAAVRFDIQSLPEEKRNSALMHAAELLESSADDILSANEKDLTAARENGMSKGMLDRLTLTKDRIRQMAEGIRVVVSLPDPLGEVLDEFDRPSGIHIKKVRVPLGVIGIIYESRPNVTADAFALTFKTGNCVVLKGGSDALYSNIAITAVLRKALSDCGIPEDAVVLIPSADREDTARFMQMREYIDVLIPRGSAGLIRAVVENSRIPVIETGSGNCHIYVDKDADIDMAVRIILNAKTQRIGVCNAAESLVVHREIEERFLPVLAKAMKDAGVLLYADEESIAFLPGSEAATEEDFAREYLDLKMSVKVVGSTEEAIAHINRYHTRHSDCIITENRDAAALFLEKIDSACVYWNASTRFTDGFEFGFGAEIGISTQMLHARGPMGLKELTGYKYLIEGTGQVRA